MKRLITNETTEEWGIKLFRLAATVVLNTNKFVLINDEDMSYLVLGYYSEAQEVYDVYAGPTKAVFPKRRYLSDHEATKRMIVDRWFHTDDIGYMELIKYKGFQVSLAELDALLITHSKVQPLLLSCKMIDEGTWIAAGIMEVFKVSYKPQRILTNSDGSVCSLLKKIIPDVHDSQFVSDVREHLEIEELMDRDVGKDIAKAEGYEIAQGIIVSCSGFLYTQCWLLPQKPLLKFGRCRSTIYRVQVSKAKKRLRRSKSMLLLKKGKPGASHGVRRLVLYKIQSSSFIKES
ncbi:hypothetical protein Tco_1243528 [Tanacetum coccineum]